MVDLLMDGIRSVLENEVDIVIEEAKKQIDKKKAEILANASIHMMRRIRIEKINHDLVIYVSLEDTENGRV